MYNINGNKTSRRFFVADAANIVVAMKIIRFRLGGGGQELCIAAGRSPLSTWTITEADSVTKTNINSIQLEQLHHINLMFVNLIPKTTIISAFTIMMVKMDQNCVTYSYKNLCE